MKGGEGEYGRLEVKQESKVQDASSLHNQCIVHKIKCVACKSVRSGKQGGSALAVLRVSKGLSILRVGESEADKGVGGGDGSHRFSKFLCYGWDGIHDLPFVSGVGPKAQ